MPSLQARQLQRSCGHRRRSDVRSSAQSDPKHAAYQDRPQRAHIKHEGALRVLLPEQGHTKGNCAGRTLLSAVHGGPNVGGRGRGVVQLVVESGGQQQVGLELRLTLRIALHRAARSGHGGFGAPPQSS